MGETLNDDLFHLDSAASGDMSFYYAWHSLDNDFDSSTLVEDAAMVYNKT